MSDASAAADPGTGDGIGGPRERPGQPQRGAAGEDLAGHIGRRLAMHRGRRGMRVAELAREVGVTPSLISQIERGLSRPSVSTLFAIAQALDVPVDAFFREPAAREPADAGTAGATPAGTGTAGTTGNGTTGHGTTPAGASSAGAAVAGAALATGSGAAGSEQARPQPPQPPGGGRYLVRRDNRAAIDIEGGVRWERLTRTTLDHLDFFELVYQPGAESHPRPYTHPGTEMVLVMSGRLEITIGFERYLLEPGDSIDFPSSMPHRYANPAAETARAVTAILYDCPGADARAPRDAHREPGGPGPR